MNKQQAVDVGFDKMSGSQKLDGLNQLLENGWTVVTIATSGGGNLLVVVEKDEE